MDFTGINPTTVLQAAVRSRVLHPDLYKVATPKRKPAVKAAPLHHHVNNGDGEWGTELCEGARCVCAVVRVEDCRKPCTIESVEERHERLKREYAAEGYSEREIYEMLRPW